MLLYIVQDIDGKRGGAKQSESESESKEMWSCSELSQRGVGGVEWCPDLRSVG